MNLRDNYSNYNNFVDMVKSLIAQKDYVKAASLLKEGLTQRPNDGWFQRFYLTVLVELSRFQEAKFWLKKIILRYENKKSSQVDAFYYKGLYYFLESELNRSMECLKKCFEIDINYFKKLLYDNTFASLKNSEKFKKLITPSKVFMVNEYISLKLIFSKTLIYVFDKLFLTCQKIALNIAPIEIEKYAEFNDIDDIIDFYRTHAATKEDISITPEEEFWVHCSNLQVWVENDYNTCVLTKNLSFPLLKELFNRGIPHFTLIFKKELIQQINKGGIKTLRVFLEDEEDYLQYLTEDDLFDNLLPFDEAEIIKNISKFIPLEYTLTTNLRDSREFSSWRDDQKMHFCIKKGHISQLEVLLGKMSNDQYNKALLQIKDLNYLEVIEIYYTYNIHKNVEKEFLKTLSISKTNE